MHLKFNDDLTNFRFALSDILDLRRLRPFVLSCSVTGSRVGRGVTLRVAKFHMGSRSRKHVLIVEPTFAGQIVLVLVD